MREQFINLKLDADNAGDVDDGDGYGDDEENEDYDVDDDARMKDLNTKSIDSI